MSTQENRLRRLEAVVFGPDRPKELDDIRVAEIEIRKATKELHAAMIRPGTNVERARRALRILQRIARLAARRETEVKREVRQ